MREKIRFNLPTIALIVVLLLGFAVRMYDLTEEPLDWNFIRQMRDTIIARSIYYQLLPNADPMMVVKAQSIASHVEVLELPVLEGLMAFLYLIFGEATWIVRIVNAICWVLGGYFIYQINKRHFSLWVAVGTLFFYLFVPLGVMASRSFQPDAWMVMWVLLSYLFLYRALEQETWPRFILAGIVAGWSILIKPTAAFYIGPVYLAMVFVHYGWKTFWKQGKVWALAGITLAPFVIYSLFNSQASADHFSLWSVGMRDMLLSPSFYIDWMLNVKRLMGLMVVAFAIAGVIIAPRKFKAFLIGGWVGYVIYGLFYPYLYATHDYYHLFLIPLVTLSLLPVFDLICGALAENHAFWHVAFAGLLLVGAGIGFLDVKKDLDERDYRPEAAAWVAIGEQIPDDGCLLTLSTDYGYRLAYYGWRETCETWPSQLDFALYEQAGKGAPDYETRFAESRQGMDYFVVLSMSDYNAQTPLQEILSDYPLVVEGDGFLVFDIREE